MGTIWVREFTGGLDARRMAETTPGGALIRARDGHINRGGEFDKRAAFVKVCDLPANTHGLAAGNTGLVTFGSDAAPVMPAMVAYQRLQEPGGATLAKLLSTTRYSSLLYAVGRFSDGDLYHFYNGQLVDDWYDNQARTSFTVLSGTAAPGTRSTGSFKMTGYNPAYGGNDTVSSVKLGTLELLNGSFSYAPSLNPQSVMLGNIASFINSRSSVSGFSATADVATGVITVSATSDGPKPQDGQTFTITNTPGSGTTFGNFVPLASGTAPVQPTMTSLKIGGVEVLTSSPLTWTGDPATYAALIASKVGNGYTATAVGAVVKIAAVSLDPSEFGKPVAFTKGTIVFDPDTGITMSTGGSFTPGSYVATVGSKIYSVSGPVLHFSGIKEPTKFQTGPLGAGFIDMSTESTGSEELQAVAKYQNFIAVFGLETIQVWYVDPDPTLNKQAQVLANTGTVSGRSVVQFSDADLFYLDESGIRSLRARDASNAAASSDIGVPIDPLIITKLAGIPVAQREDIKSVIEPRDGRYWLVIGDEIYVFSYFPGSKVSAWSVYTPTITANGVTTTLVIDDIAVYKRKVYIRAGNAVYVYGGLGVNLEYDDTEPEAWLPYLDGGTPTRLKDLKGVDVACEGLWEVSIAMQPNNLSAVDKIGFVDKTSFNADTIPAENASTHFALRFRGVGGGAHKLASAVIHFEGEAESD